MPPTSQLDPGQITKITYDATNEAVKVNLVAGSASFTVDSEQADDTPFVPGGATLLIGALADNVAPDSVDEGDVGAVRMSNNRNLYTQIRDAAGNERGVNITAASEMNVLASAQPGVDIGDVTINNAVGVGAVNIQDGGNSITVDGTVAATQSGAWNITNVSGTVSLPTGASTLAEQQTQTTSLQLLDDSVATTGAAITAKGIAAVGTDGTNARILKTDAAGELQIDVLSSALPTGASTSALQTTGNTSLSSIDTKVPANLTVTATRLLTDGSGVTQPVSAASLPLPTGASTEATLSTLNGKIATFDLDSGVGTQNVQGVSLRKTASGGSVELGTSTDPVRTDPTGTTAQPITDNGGSITVDGTVSAAQSGVWNITNVSGTVSLPTGAATEATLTAQSAKLPATLGQKTMAASLAVAIASDQSALPVTGTFFQATQPVSAASLPLPAGASTSALQTTGNTSLSSIDTKVPANLTVTATRLLVDGSGVTQPVSGTVTVAALDVVDFFDTPVLDASVTNITASAGNPVQVVATLAANVKKIKVNDTIGEYVGVYTGAALSEVLQCIVGPGEDGSIDVGMASGERVSVRNMANAALTSGKICIQFIG